MDAWNEAEGCEPVRTSMLNVYLKNVTIAIFSQLRCSGHIEKENKWAAIRTNKEKFVKLIKDRV